MEVRYYSLKQWRENHQNDLNTRVGIENVSMPQQKATIKFVEVTLKNGMKQIITEPIK